MLRNLDAARTAGVEQVQVDLIFGVKDISPNRSISSEILDLQRSGSTGVSCYLLTIEESTPFAGENSAEDEVIVKEYDEILSVSHSVGFLQHETSNFSVFPPIHNRLYWYGLPYLGLGTGAHGLLPADAQHPLRLRGIKLFASSVFP